MECARGPEGSTNQAYSCCFSLFRGVINGNAALPKFLYTLTLSQPGVADYAHPLALPQLNKFCDYAPAIRTSGVYVCNPSSISELTLLVVIPFGSAH